MTSRLPTPPASLCFLSSNTSPRGVCFCPGINRSQAVESGVECADRLPLEVLAEARGVCSMIPSYITIAVCDSRHHLLHCPVRVENRTRARLFFNWAPIIMIDDISSATYLWSLGHQIGPFCELSKILTSKPLCYCMAFFFLTISQSVTTGG